MGPRLKLPNNFRVKTFWSSRNNLGVGDFQAVCAGDAPSVPIVISSASTDVVTHISETRLSDSAPAQPEKNCLSEATVVYLCAVLLNAYWVNTKHCWSRWVSICPHQLVTKGVLGLPLTLMYCLMYRHYFHWLASYLCLMLSIV